MQADETYPEAIRPANGYAPATADWLAAVSAMAKWALEAKVKSRLLAGRHTLGRKTGHRAVTWELAFSMFGGMILPNGLGLLS